MANTMTVTDSNFETEIEKSSGLAVVDFWAEWCGPCRMIGPVIDQLAAEYAGKAKVTKLNVDEAQKTTVKYGVRNIPTVLFFKDGKLVDQIVGAQPKAAFDMKFKQHAAN